jgi:hypothetical protein
MMWWPTSRRARRNRTPPPYQTQINQTLRGAMKGAQAAGLTARQSNASDVRAALLSDERFIKAAAAQVAQVRPAPKGKRRRAA